MQLRHVKIVLSDMLSISIILSAKLLYSCVLFVAERRQHKERAKVPTNYCDSPRLYYVKLYLCYEYI